MFPWKWVFGVRAEIRVSAFPGVARLVEGRYTHPMTQNTTTIWVCEDCLFVHANGESEGMDPNKVPFRLIEEGDTVALGMSWEDHSADCPNRAAGEHVEECECETDNFSRSSCDACGDPLAGSRHAMTIFHN